MGHRIIEEFCAKSGCEACNDFKDTAENIAKESILPGKSNKVE